MIAQKQHNEAQDLRWYEQNARQVARQYENNNFEQLHAWVMDLLPHRDTTAPRGEVFRVLDIGAGSGRDALWFACRGYDVTAVEPCEALRREAQRLHGHKPEWSRINWLSCGLPELKDLNHKNFYDVIWLSAVWMHVPPEQRARAFERLVQLMRPDALMMFSLRRPIDPTRGMYEVSLSSLEQLAKQNTILMATYQVAVRDQERPQVEWDCAALKRPQDIAHGLSRIRHIIKYDKKTTTYKLALLRTLCRVADSFRHFVADDGDMAQIPLGLVALIWYQLYHPLLNSKIAQIGGRRQTALENENAKTKALLRYNLAAYIDLRPGGIVNLNHQSKLNKVFKEIIGTIQRGPVRHICADFLDKRFESNTAALAQSPIFKITKASKNSAENIALRHRMASYSSAEIPKYADLFKIQSQTQFGLMNDEYFKSFGVLEVPSYIWQALCRYSTWIEPTIVFEWQELIQKFYKRKKEVLDLLLLNKAMLWQDGVKHNTTYVRDDIMAPLFKEGKSVHCVWTGNELDIKDRATDHCLPFALWPCNDLWNLMPSDKKINLNKKDKLPSRQALTKAEENIQSWWQHYMQNPVFKQKFCIEARMRLPLYAWAKDNPDTIELQDVFNGLRFQQLQIKKQFSPPEWSPP